MHLSHRYVGSATAIQKVWTWSFRTKWSGLELSQRPLDTLPFFSKHDYSELLPTQTSLHLPEQLLL